MNRAFFISIVPLISCLSIVTFGQSRSTVQAIDSLPIQTDSSQLRKLVLQKGRHLKSVMRYDEAAEVFAYLLQDGRIDSEALAEIADCNYMDGNYSGAKTFYTMLSISEPDNIIAGVRLMQISYRGGEYQESIRLGRNIIKMDRIPAVCALVGDSFNRAGQKDSALVYYREALRLRPLYPDVIDRMSDILLSAGKYDEVISISESYLSERPDNIRINSVKGMAQYLKENYQSSLETFRSMSALGDDSYGTHLMLGRNYLQLDRPYEAEDEFMKAYAIDSTKVELVLNIASVKAELLAVDAGIFRVDDRKHSEMEIWFDKALSMIEPPAEVKSEIWRRRGLAYFKLADWRKAGKCYEESLKYGITDVGVYTNLGYCYQMEQNWEKALYYYKKGLELSEYDARLRTYLQQRVEDMEGEVFMLGS